MTSTFNRTLQFITSIKLEELEKQRLAHKAHAVVLDQARALDETDPVAKVELLLKAVREWSGAGAIPTLGTIGGTLSLANLDLWLLQAKQDPSFGQDILKDWADTLETHIRQTSLRFNCARLFGSLCNEWLASGDSSTAVVDGVNGPEADDLLSTISSEFVDVGRREMHEQMEKLVSIIFDEKPIDTERLLAYLADLFSNPEATKALEGLRKDLDKFGTELRSKQIKSSDVYSAIEGLLASGLMDEGKRATLTEFLENSVVTNEVASVLNMRMASLETWAWPAEGIVVEMRRHLNGKYRAFTDPEIIDALLLQYIGVAWQVRLKNGFRCIFQGKAWKKKLGEISTADRSRWEKQVGESHGIEGGRQHTRETNFFLSQLSSVANQPSTYDDLLDTPSEVSSEGGGQMSPAEIKQQLLRIMTTECQLNTTLYGSHAIIRSDLEWFGPSLPHVSILTILKFFGMPKQWVAFVQGFLSAPLRFKQDPPGQVQIRGRGTPISYALSVVCGEAFLFVMDFAVNKRADGMFLYRMHDDLWLWDSTPEKCTAAWREMNLYANLVGIKFNESKTGSACVGTQDASGLPAGNIRWGFLKFDQDQAQFVIDQKDVDLCIVELRSQLHATKSVFGWVNAYNKYMAFFLRNFGGHPALCFGKAHVMGIIDTFGRVQRELFPGGGAVGHLRSVVERRFGLSDLPEGYFYFPISRGGLGLQNPMVAMFLVQKAVATNLGSEEGFVGAVKSDQEWYEEYKERFEKKGKHRTFMSFEEYRSLRETWLSEWRKRYDTMACPIKAVYLELTSEVSQRLVTRNEKGALAFDWAVMHKHDRWVLSMYGVEMMKKFGGLEIVDPTLIPVGIVQLFRNSRMKLDE